MPVVGIMAADGSEFSERAFQWYVKTFYKPDHKIILLHIPELVAVDCLSDPGIIMEKQREIRSTTEKLEKKWKDMAKTAKITFDWKVETCDKLGHGIVDVASREGAAFIVTGTRGLNKSKRKTMGSVSDYVIHHSHVPVLVCKEVLHD